MLKRRKASKMGIRESAQLRSPAHLQWVRGHDCAVKDASCEGRVEACHVRTGTDGGTGVKPSDRYVIPLCAYHHSRQHNIGEAAFERHYLISMLSIAATLWVRSPARNALVKKGTVEVPKWMIEA